MKVLKRIFQILVVILVIAVAVGIVYLHNLKTAAIPDYNKNVKLKGMEKPASVYRDAYAVPHVYADNEADLYRAVGFTMAQDRLWQMDLLRRVTQGRLSEILGKDQVDTDLLMRALRIQEKSEKIMKTLPPEIKSALEAFSDGVNQYIENYPLPPEFKVLGYKPEPWKPVHSVNLIGYMSWDLSAGWSTEYFLHKLRNEVADDKIAELIPDMEKYPTEVYPEFGKIKLGEDGTLLSASEKLTDLGGEIFCGSNNWAVAGKKSVTGKPILANDMHLGLFAPGIWYQMHQKVDGKLDVTGVVVPGQPFVICGHNDSIAWGMTNVMLDDLDYYAEKLNKDSTKYWFDGAWRDLIIKKQVMPTKEGDTVVVDLKFTHRGPIVNRFKHEKETALSVRWLGNEMSNEIGGVYMLNRANNWSDFRKATSNFKSISQNIVYADVKGNIGLQCSAGIPIREGSGIEIYPGDSSKYDWKGLVPFEELPYEFNPERGYVSSANNKTVSNDYPYYVSYWYATPSRINRIREMLEAKDKLSVNDFEAMQSDWKSKTAEKMTPVFVKALQNKEGWSETEKSAFDELKTWDGNLTRESQAASIFEILYRKTMEDMVKDELSPQMFDKMLGQKMLLENMMINTVANNNSSQWVDNVKTEKVETFNDIVEQAFKETVNDLTAQLGNDVKDWEWQKIHTLTLKHPLGVVKMLDRVLHLNRGPFGVPGSYHTVNPYSYSFRDLYEGKHGASHRHVYSTANWDDSQTVIPTGTSGIPSSKFYLDQTNMYLHNQYHDDNFSKDHVANAAKFSMQIMPE
jgi:penicillin amidase